VELDLTEKPEWRALCEFLGVREPQEPFPWVNRGVSYELEAR
jgi:hypothetical protein